MVSARFGDCIDGAEDAEVGAAMADCNELGSIWLDELIEVDAAELGDAKPDVAEPDPAELGDAIAERAFIE